MICLIFMLLNKTYNGCPINHDKFKFFASILLQTNLKVLLCYIYCFALCFDLLFSLWTDKVVSSCQQSRDVFVVVAPLRGNCG